ncbi:MAG: bifunctional serine/threonine-protein kinase/formylglycine-generating enzyme family protein [Acidobacteriota bacterium]
MDPTEPDFSSDAAASESPAPVGTPSRYRDLGAIASGGMGDVRRVHDHELDRVLAMKVLRWDRKDDDDLRRRFAEEARRTAGLQHPGIVAIHDWGELPDGRLWFTMPEVRGRTFSQALEEFHATGDGADAPGFRRLVEALVQACRAVAHAHRRGVLHRDIKPDNLMLGEHGEALLMDFGIARPATTEEDGEREVTGPGRPLGTPAYMAPEQARGDRERTGPATDVHGLGTVLFELLAGRPPHEGSGHDILRRIVAGERAQLPVAGVPDELRRACERAMATEPEHRHADADALADEVLGWLDGSRRREEARRLLAEARALEPERAALRDRVRSLRRDADALLSAVEPHDPVEAKLPGWALEDEATELVDEMALLEGRWLETVHGALNVLPDFAEAHEALADFYRERVEEAEARRDPAGALRAETMLRGFDRGRHAAFLSGHARLSLVTDPPDAEVLLARYETRERRLQLGPVRSLGRAPLREVKLERGSYLLTLRAEGRVDTSYPIVLERGGCWDGVPPGAEECAPVRLPRSGELSTDEVHVPAGWCVIGGDEEAPDSLERRWAWVDDFVIGRAPVTNAQYIEFLDDLVEQGRDDEALEWAPTLRGGAGSAGGQEVPAFTRTAAGGFELPGTPDATGQVWQPAWPVVLITWEAARAYCAWRAKRDDLPWRLPHELEREKAARGVDGRLHPWGDFSDPTWARVLGCAPGPPGLAAVGEQPVDCSPHGLLDGAGNVRDWCLEAWTREGPELVDGRLLVGPVDGEEDVAYRVVRGGSWSAVPRLGRCAARLAARPAQRLGTLGFRMARSLPRAN